MPLLSGPLIDCISSSLLVNPENGLPIILDVLGNPRVDNNGRRNIGAIQTLLAPFLSASSNRTGGTILLNWVPPLAPANLTGYHICYCPTSSPCSLDCSQSSGNACPYKVDVNDSMAVSVSISGLQNGQDYSFCVSGTNAQGPGPSSNVVTSTPYGQVTAPQVTLTTETIACNSLSVAWTEPNLGGFSLLEYAVIYFPTQKIEWRTTIETTWQNATIPGPLLANTEYTVCVVAVAINPTNGDLQYGNPGCLNATTACTVRPSVAGLRIKRKSLFT